MQPIKLIIKHLKNYSRFMLLITGVFLFNFTISSCGAPKTGCPINESAKTKVNKNGELSKKKGSSNLFPKKVRKKMKT